MVGMAVLFVVLAIIWEPDKLTTVAALMACSLACCSMMYGGAHRAITTLQHRLEETGGASGQ